MLLMVEKGIIGAMCHAIHQHAKANNKNVKDYDKNKDSSCLQYLDVNNLYGWAMSQKLPVNNFNLIEDTSQFNEYFIKNYNEKSDKGCFLEFDVQYLKILHGFHNDLPYYEKELKLKNSKSL